MIARTSVKKLHPDLLFMEKPQCREREMVQIENGMIAL